MRYEEAMNLKEGDLVIVDARSNCYGGLILEVESVDPEHDNWCYRVTLKQPCFNSNFRIKNHDSRRLKRYEP